MELDVKNDALEAAFLDKFRVQRWKNGLRCPRCGGHDCGVHMRSGAAGRRKLLCHVCGRVFNDLTGTPFARSHMPLSAWFAAAKLLIERERTCADIARKLKIKLPTAWRMRRVLNLALADPVLRRILAEEDPPSCA